MGQRFIELCDHISQWTEDRDFSVGAVIVGPDQEIRSTGFNGLRVEYIATMKFGTIEPPEKSSSGSSMANGTQSITPPEWVYRQTVAPSM